MSENPQFGCGLWSSWQLLEQRITWFSVDTCVKWDKDPNYPSLDKNDLML